MSIKDGGKYSENWTVMDEFAAKAMQGFCANPDISKHAFDKGLFGRKLDKPFAESAYALANAMLREREKHA